MAQQRKLRQQLWPPLDVQLGIVAATSRTVALSDSLALVWKPPLRVLVTMGKSPWAGFGLLPGLAFPNVASIAGSVHLAVGDVHSEGVMVSGYRFLGKFQAVGSSCQAWNFHPQPRCS